MSHADGFTTADVDVTILDDSKVRALVRSIDDEGLVARCVIGYVATMLGSWHAGARIPLEDAAPLWLTDVKAIAEHLVRVKLLDSRHRVLEHAFAARFGIAHQRREETRDRWRRAKKGRRATSDGADFEEPARLPRGNSAESTPSVPPVPSSPSLPSSPIGPSSPRPRGTLEPVGSIAPRVLPGGRQT